MEESCNPCTRGSRSKRRRMLSGLQLETILTPPQSHSPEQDPGRFPKRKQLDSENHNHGTRQRIRGTRDRKEVNYDAKFHPMDKYTHRSRYNAHKRRSVRNGLTTRIVANSDSGEEGEAADDDDDAVTDCGSDSGYSVAVGSISSGESDVAEVPRLPILSGHPSPEGRRKSSRLRMQTKERPIYSAKIHPQDAAIPFYRHSAIRKLEKDKKLAENESKKKRKLQESQDARTVTSRKGSRTNSRAEPNLSVSQFTQEDNRDGRNEPNLASSETSGPVSPPPDGVEADSQKIERDKNRAFERFYVEIRGPTLDPVSTGESHPKSSPNASFLSDTESHNRDTGTMSQGSSAVGSTSNANSPIISSIEPESTSHLNQNRYIDGEDLPDYDAHAARVQAELNTGLADDEADDEHEDAVLKDTDTINDMLDKTVESRNPVLGERSPDTSDLERSGSESALFHTLKQSHKTSTKRFSQGDVIFEIVALEE